MFSDKQGISKRFSDYIRGLDASLGQKALGPEQTVSGKVQSKLKDAQDRARTIDEQKGYSKVAHEVGKKPLFWICVDNAHHCSTTQRRFRLPLESLSSTFTPIHPSKFATFMKKLVASSTSTRINQLRLLRPPVLVRPDPKHNLLLPPKPLPLLFESCHNGPISSWRQF
jgi:hypothetical protein